MTGVAGTMVMVRVADPVPPALIALMVIAGVPVLVGVPLMTPVLELSVNPVGSADDVKEVGFWDAVIVYVNAEPTCPDADVLLEITGAGGFVIVMEVIRKLLPAPFVAHSTG